MKQIINVYKIIFTALVFIVATAKVNAQLAPLSGQYYNNQYLGNPALAGINSGLALNAAYRQQWDQIPGAPQVQSLTATYGFDKVGLGVNVMNDKAGLQRQTRIVGTYAYHLPLNQTNSLHFGVSFGLMNQRLETSDIYGDPDDVLIGQYNARKAYVDGDFGIAFTSKGFNIQASLPNLKTFFKKDEIKVADVATFYSAVGYKIKLTDGPDHIAVEPKVAYRGVKGFNNILDAGAQFTMAGDQVMLTGLYHSNQCATFGIGMDLKKKYLISAMYTTQTSKLNGYSNGTFELNLGLFFGETGKRL